MASWSRGGLAGLQSVVLYALPEREHRHGFLLLICPLHAHEVSQAGHQALGMRLLVPLQDMASWSRDGIAGLQSVVLYALPELDGP